MDLVSVEHNLPAVAPDLVIGRRSEEQWLVRQVSSRLAGALDLDFSTMRGRDVRAVFVETIPSLAELAQEVLATERQMVDVPMHLRHDSRVFLATVTPGGLGEDYREPLVHFSFRVRSNDLASDDFPSTRFGLVGSSPGMLEVYRKVELYAGSDATVLVTGETGTGKELIARALHEQSGRKSRPFVAVNCSAISAELLESELFGHEKGAFTGAVRDHRGRFERAHGGTIFLDEIGDMPIRTQAKLLRVLETGLLERVGAEREIAVDVRVVGATNVSLEGAVGRGAFRSDLYHRIAVLRIHLPPLRLRMDDLSSLIKHFIELFNRKYFKSIKRLTPEALALLRSYLWPGNVRELRNVLERVFVETDAEVIGARAFAEWVRERQDFSPGDWGVATEIRSSVAPPVMAPYEPALGVTESVNTSGRRVRRTTQPANLSVERIRDAYRQSRGNLAEAARQLNVHRATFYRYLKKYGISRDDLH